MRKANIEDQGSRIRGSVGMLTTVAATMAAAVALAQQPFDLDPSFGTGIQQQYVSSIHPLAEGKLLISGLFQLPALSGNYTLSRLNSDGTRDVSFNSSGLGQGKLTAWTDRFYVGTNQTVRRVLLQGVQDPTFIEMNDGPYFSSLQGGDYHVFPDGRVLMSGTHALSDTARGFAGLYDLVWFTNTGYLDTTRTHRQSNGVLYEFEQTTDGKFLCTGTMTTYENHPVARIFRIQPDGDLDISFEANIDDNWGEAFVFRTLDNGMILAGGMFRQGGSTADTLCLIRLNSSGELDPSFEQLRFKATFTAGSPIPYVVDILPMADGRYVITGRFDRINDEERGGIALIGSDGELLEDAFAGEGCGPYDYQGTIYKSISGIVPIDDGSYYIHGAYHGYDDGTTNDTQQRMVSRLFGLDVGMQESDGAERVHLYPDPTGSNATLQLDALPRSATLVVRDALGREVQRRRITDHYTTLTLQGASGVFMVEVWDANGRIATERLVVE